MSKLARSLHLPGRMLPWHLRITPALCAVLLLASQANAQGTAGTGGTTAASGGISVNPISVGGEEVTLDLIRLGIEECERDAVLVFELDSVPPDKESIDIYTGENCQQTDRNNEDVNRCEYITTLSTNNQTQDLEIELMASALFESCDANREAEPTLWFLAVDSPESSEAVGTGFGTFRLSLDTTRPDAPTDVRGGSGENTIRISWGTDDAGLQGFRIYIDSTPTAGGGGAAGAGAQPDDDAGTDAPSTGDCGSDELVPGTVIEDTSGVQVREVLRASATGFDLDASAIDGDSAAVAVVALDEAGNESPLSNIGCVSIAPTTGFWDRYRENGGEDVSGCPCSALGPAQVQSAWPVALALLFVRRASRRRRQS